MILWLFEWLYIIEYTFNYWSFTRIFFPYSTPVALLVCFLYWIYMWGISVWSSTQYGRFTRGDSKLWAKSLASFWIVEFSTMLGLYIAAMWMSWGPLPIMPRIFLMAKKGLLIEITLFTYVIWLLYLMRFSLKWCLWRTQFVITLLIMFILGYLLWRDIIGLYTKEIVNINQGSKWRHMSVTNLMYSLSESWWMNYFMGKDVHQNSYYKSMNEVMLNNFQLDPFNMMPTMTEYDKFNWMPVTKKSYMTTSGLFWNVFDSMSTGNYNKYENWFSLNMNSNLKKSTADLGLTYDSHQYYPRSMGFYPKKIAMWYLLTMLKMWHHFMLMIWWFLYLMRLYVRQKSSYTLLSACYFNVYCCFLMSVLLYLYYMLPLYEGFFSMTKPMRSRFFNRSEFAAGLEYIWSLITTMDSQHLSLKIKYGMMKDITPNYIGLYEDIMEWVMSNKDMKVVTDSAGYDFLVEDDKMFGIEKGVHMMDSTDPADEMASVC